MPILRYDPYTGKPLIKEGELPIPPKAPKTLLVEQSIPEAPPTPQIEEEPKINPFTALDNRPNIEPLIKEVNELLKHAEDMLKARTSQFKVRNSVIPQGFVYKPTITRENSGSEGFMLKKPEAPLEIIGSSMIKDIVIDRVFLDPTDVKVLLNNKSQALNALINLVSEMYENLINLKQLNENKTYYGTTVATISKPGQANKFCSDYQEEYIEIRLYSDVVELKEGEENVIERENTSSSQQSQGSETIAFGTH